MRELQFISWVVITVLSLFLFYITTAYLSFKPDVNFLLVKQDIINHSLWRPTFYVHVISSMLVILVGPFQFLETFRNRYLTLHKMSGKIYVYSILLLAAPSGFIMAFYAEGGLYATIPFVLMSVFWFYTTLVAVLKIMQGKIVEHKQWMMRSFAFTLAAVTLRLLVPFFSTFILDNEDLITISTAWLSWLLNLFIVEGIIFAQNKKMSRLKSSFNS